MKKKQRRLPQPAGTPFGRSGRREEDGPQPLMADALAMAAAEGRLDEFMKREVPDSDYARSLVSMMMGMTGIAYGGAAGPGTPPGPSPEGKTEAAEGEPKPPGEVLRAVAAGDVAGLMGLLRHEHERRTGSTDEMAGEQPSQPAGPGAEQEVLDSLIGIAEDNGLSVDWVVLRALKLYVEEYRKTGRL